MHTLRSVLESKPKAIHATSPATTVIEAVDAMCNKRVGALLVREGETTVGILSERDILSRIVLARRDPATTRVGDVMTRDIVCIGIDVAPEEAMAVMTERRCRHLPVVLDGKVIGVVSIGDLVRWASRSQEYEIRMLDEYLAGKYPG
jgi:signal-transduction protein with cAMP-binding, CBS, and nucleotidyltransferase domain